MMKPIDFLNMGIAVIPISYRSKKPNQRFLPHGMWKHYQKELPTPQDVKMWESTLTNFAVVCGWENLVVVDFDDLNAHNLWMNTRGKDGFANTLTTTTGRGFHYYYISATIPDHTLSWVGGEVKSTGYVLIPPSIHPTRRRYSFVNPDVPIMDVGSIYDVLPEEIFVQGMKTSSPLIVGNQDPFDPPTLSSGCFGDANKVDMLKFFEDPVPTNNGFYSVFCPFHDDGGTKGKRSGFVNGILNRFGCHVCVNGTMGTVDLYSKLFQVDPETAVAELIGGE